MMSVNYTPHDSAEKIATDVYHLIEAYGWRITCRGPVPDDGWPIDIIAHAIREANKGNRDVLMAGIRMDQKNRDLVAAMALQTAVINAQRDRIAALSDALSRLGEQANSCTFEELGVICAGCRCGRLDAPQHPLEQV
jgi:hypothetical protein